MVPAITARDEMIAPAPGTARTGPTDPPRHEVTVPAVPRDERPRAGGTPVDGTIDRRGPASAAGGRGTRALDARPVAASRDRAVPAVPSPLRAPAVTRHDARVDGGTIARPSTPVWRARRGRSARRGGRAAIAAREVRRAVMAWRATGAVRIGLVPRGTTASAPTTAGGRAVRRTGEAPPAAATAPALIAVPNGRARRTVGGPIGGSPVSAAGRIAIVPVARGAAGRHRPRAGDARPPVATATTTPADRGGAADRTGGAASAGPPNGRRAQATAAAAPTGAPRAVTAVIGPVGRTAARGPDQPGRPVATGPVATGPVATGPVTTGPVTTGPVTTGAGPSGPRDMARPRAGAMRLHRAVRAGTGGMRQVRRGADRVRPVVHERTGRSRPGASSDRPVRAGTGPSRDGVSSGRPVACAGPGRNRRGAGRGRAEARAGIARGTTAATDPTGVATDGTAAIGGRPETRVAVRIGVRPVTGIGPSGARRRV